jgi:hypothetical protein
MIRNITGGYGIQVSGSVYNAPYIDTTRASAGMVRYTNGNLEVYDGSSWLPLQSSYPQVELSGEVQSIINWARVKMAEEARIQELATKHPTVADALLARDRAEDALKMTTALCDIK